MANNPWGQIGDEFGEIMEQGGKQAGQTAKAATVGVVQKAFQEFTGGSEQHENPIEKATGEKQYYSLLNVASLERKYEAQDLEKLQILRKRLFNIVKNDEKAAYDEVKKKEQERLQKIENDEIEKKQKEMSQPQEMIQGTSKAKRGMTATKAVKNTGMEQKANGGKQ